MLRITSTANSVVNARWSAYVRTLIKASTTVYPKKYAHGFVVLCFVVVMQSFIMNSHEVFIHIHQGCFAGIGAIVRLPQCQWSKPDGYGKISQCITTTKHSKAKTVCIFLGIYCSPDATNTKLIYLFVRYDSIYFTPKLGHWRNCLLINMLSELLKCNLQFIYLIRTSFHTDNYCLSGQECGFLLYV